ncbi:hypothetical protein PFICI_09330 [Pestalotiopsis fici W106-1]|uniref:Zn(2)-C6 fungal-type domain-containing protein n=1 Tax=Pestalotiopsis fici (strain W106-1 / CGMCC3.15140) TaxID=1229662 RepID=W3X268_PESFW|nr:uncharacterized protein PFICI_09330 [Pestalotiopsis fici W106-1]ETS79477.1 hypothetical protein PFICI_09330 [Pestalotiopsis fici W106-1]
MASNLNDGADVGFDFDFELDFNNVSDLGNVELDFALNNPSPGADGPSPAAQPSTEDINRPYHSKRPHKKSRAGCKQCKQRKVKCDEGRPRCRSCTLRKETCVYPTPAATSTALVRSGKSPSSAASSRSPREHSPQQMTSSSNSPLTVVTEPMFIPAGTSDAVDMKMLWFYTAETCHSFNIEGGRQGATDTVLRVTIPQLAFESPFLMQTLMGLSALHFRILKQPVPPEKAAKYRARAFEGYRTSIELARPQDYPALLAGSLLICALASEMFREPETKPLYIIDWLVVWRGIGLIVDLISPSTIAESGLAALFFRPPINLNKSQRWIPNNLLYMVEAIQPGDDDYEHKQIYYEVLRYLGSLYQELETGFSPLMDLRVITFFTFLPRTFIPLAQQHRPRALIIIAHYCAFTKQNLGPWWMKDIGDRQIREICEEVGEVWEPLLRVPLKVTTLTDRVEVAKAILQNDTWTAPDRDLYSFPTRDPRVKSLRLINNLGQEMKVADGEWEAMGPPLLLDKMTLDDKRTAPSDNAVVGQILDMAGQPIDTPSPASATPSSSTTSGSSATETAHSPDVSIYQDSLGKSGVSRI